MKKGWGATKGCNAWAIKMPFAKQPYLFPFSIRRTRKESIEAFGGLKPWEYYYRVGYRVVKVRVEAAP